jgi:hypothetical protein
MSSLIWFIVVVVIVLTIVGLVMTAKQRRHSLQERFGPEYDRSVTAAGGRRAGERQLREKAARRDELDIRPLSAQAREHYADEWALVQEGFVDEPGDAVNQADALVARVMKDRGYPVEDFETRSDMAAVDHPDVVEHYRAAHEIHSAHLTGSADTEQLRTAFVHYRSLFDALLGDPSAVDDRQRNSVEDEPRGTRDDDRQPSSVDDRQDSSLDDRQPSSVDDQQRSR